VRERGSEGARQADRQHACSRPHGTHAHLQGRERYDLSPPPPGWRRVRVTLDPGSPMSMALTRSMCRMEMSWRQGKIKEKDMEEEMEREKEEETKEETAVKHHGWVSVRRSLSVNIVPTFKQFSFPSKKLNTRQLLPLVNHVQHFWPRARTHAHTHTHTEGTLPGRRLLRACHRARSYHYYERVPPQEDSSQ
jgi:hypothetical protein